MPNSPAHRPPAHRPHTPPLAFALAFALGSACALHATPSTAITSQRDAINATSIIATDNIDDLTLGNLASALKHMPGISLSYAETEATAVRIGGLSSKYTTASIDGIAISTNARAFDLPSLSATGVESIEFIQTLTASMDAASAAGRLNLVTKDPFNNRPGHQLRFQFGLDANSKGMRLGGTWLPDDRKHSLWDPGLHINYGGLFLNNRLAIEFNISRYGAYNLRQEQSTTYSYLNPDPNVNPDFDPDAAPQIVALSWRPSPQLTETFASNLNLGFKITPSLTFSLRSAYAHQQRRTYTPRTTLQAYSTSSYAPSPGTNPVSTPTNWIVNPSLYGSTGTRLLNEYNQYNSSSNLKTLSSRLSYKHNNLTIDFTAGYAGYIRSSRDTEDGFFRSSSAYLPGLGWTATRPSPGSQNWTISQTAGPDWTTTTDWRFAGSGIISTPARARNEQYTAALDLTHASSLLGIPITLKAGAAFRRNDYENHAEENHYTFIGPPGNQSGLGIPTTQNYTYHTPLGESRTIDARTLYNTFLDSPDWFFGSSDNLLRKLTFFRDLSEDVSAAYVELNGRHNRLQFNLGARFENTSLKSKALPPRRSPEEIFDAGYPVNSNGDATTPEGILYQYHDGRRATRSHSYSDFFLSGGLKYDITPALQARLSASQSILRPDYDALANPISYAGNAMLLPNPTLKPEHITKYQAGFHWLIAPASTLSLSAYRMEIKDRQIRYPRISQEAAENILGHPTVPSGDDIYDPHSFYTILNAPDQIAVHGLTLAYDQQLTFLPSVLKGIGLFGSITFSSIGGANIPDERIGQIKRSANAGIRYLLGRLSLHLCGTWNDSSLQSVTSPSSYERFYLNDRQYEKARLIIDLSGGFRITKHLEIALSVRNLTNVPRVWYSGAPDRISRRTIDGSLWNLSLKGNF